MLALYKLYSLFRPQTVSAQFEAVENNILCHITSNVELINVTMVIMKVPFQAQIVATQKIFLYGSPYRNSVTFFSFCIHFQLLKFIAVEKYNIG